jgi:hypothetical protein
MRYPANPTSVAASPIPPLSHRRLSFPLPFPPHHAVVRGGGPRYESWLGAGWNVGWTFLPIIAVGIRETDLSPSTVLKFPMIYAMGQSNVAFSPLKLGQVGVTTPWRAGGVGGR